MVTIEFQLYNMTGLTHKVTVTSPDPDAFLAEYLETIRALEEQGFGEKQPDPSLMPKHEHIVGWVLGEANTNQAGVTQLCVYLFNDIDAFTYKTATVYADRLKELPLGDVEGKKEWVGEPGAAPSRANARNKGYMNPCDFSILMAPKVDFKTGKALTKPNSKGEEVIQYRFVRVTKVHSYPPMSFDGPEAAVRWGAGTGVFTLGDVEAQQEYDLLRERVKPASASAMWKAWVAHINSMLVDKDRD